MIRHLLRFRLLLLASMVFLLASCSSMPGSSPSLVGTWTPVSADLDGAPFAVSGFVGATLKLTADTYQFGIDKGLYAVVSSAPPGKMDIRGQEGPNAGRTIPAIYEISGDQLTICYQLGKGDRPTEFKSSPASMTLLVHYRRG
jgi:uncharacterized protein (TIGR03067 family)